MSHIYRDIRAFLGVTDESVARIGYDSVMSRDFEFTMRPAQDGDFVVAEATYIDEMSSLMMPLGCWNEAERRAAFQLSYKTSEVSFLTHDGHDIGWIQISERESDLNLAQIQIFESYRNCGIATQLIMDLQKRAFRKGKSVSLSAVRTNKAIKLYERLGFSIVDPDATPIIDMVLKKSP